MLFTEKRDTSENMNKAFFIRKKVKSEKQYTYNSAHL